MQDKFCTAILRAVIYVPTRCYNIEYQSQSRIAANSSLHFSVFYGTTNSILLLAEFLCYWISIAAILCFVYAIYLNGYMLQTYYSYENKFVIL